MSVMPAEHIELRFELHFNRGEFRVLAFKSWWNEADAFGLSRRNIDIFFNMETNSVQVQHTCLLSYFEEQVLSCLVYLFLCSAWCLSQLILDKADKVYTVSHIQGKHGPLECWDLHVGVKIDLLGRKTTLMQSSLVTAQWLDFQAARLTKMKLKLSKEMQKYDRTYHGERVPKNDSSMERVAKVFIFNLVFFLAVVHFLSSNLVEWRRVFATAIE
jgi:hypothetical protein